MSRLRRFGWLEVWQLACLSGPGKKSQKSRPREIRAGRELRAGRPSTLRVNRRYGMDAAAVKEYGASVREMSRGCVKIILPRRCELLGRLSLRILPVLAA